MLWRRLMRARLGRSEGALVEVRRRPLRADHYEALGQHAALAQLEQTPWRALYWLLSMLTQKPISPASPKLPKHSHTSLDSSSKKTRTRPVSPDILATWKGQTPPIIVDVDFVAAGGIETYSYLCVITQGAAFVQRTMN